MSIEFKGETLAGDTSCVGSIRNQEIERDHLRSECGLRPEALHP